MSSRDNQEPQIKSILARLGNAHRERNAAGGVAMTRPEVFTLYAIERILYRIGRSHHANQLVLKGGMLAGALFDNPWRATRDADLLGPGKRPSVRRIRGIFESIAAVDTWTADGIHVERVRTMRAREDGPDGYNGVKVLLDVSVGGTVVLVQVDVGFGDGVVPKPRRLALPPLIQHETIPPASVYAYPIEAFIAEKMETLLSKFPAIAHRLKDFVDIYVAITTRSFDAATTVEAFRASFSARRSPYRTETLTALAALAADNATRQEWSKMLKERRVTVSLPDMRDVVALVSAFAGPLLVALAREEDLAGTWHPAPAPGWFVA